MSWIDFSVFDALAMARWAQFGSVMLLFGASLFHLYAPSGVDGPSTRWRWLVAVVTVTATAWLSASIVSVTDDGWALMDVSTWKAYLVDTSFGHAWLVRIGLLVVLAVAVAFGERRQGRWSNVTVASASGLLVASQAWLGHPAASAAAGNWWPVAAYVAHTVGAAAWLGGLWPLYAMLRAPKVEAGVLATSLRVFSTAGILAVTVVALGGIVMAASSVGSFHGLIATIYGRIVIVKAILFVIAVLLALQNRLVFAPRLSTPDPSDAAVRGLQRNVVAECVLLGTLLLVASVLGLTPPPH